jgi:hypothetical protein
MFDKITQYYDDNGISARSYVNKRLKCKYFDQCSVKKPYTPAKEAFVSTGYEEHKIPRLLVISLDPKPSNSYNEVEDRTLKSIRQIEELSPTENYYDMGEKTHWRKTFDMVFVLLRDFIGSRNRDEVRHYFAHTNSAKCHDKAGSEQASIKLFDNCSEFLPGEFLLLDPVVVVTQGAEKIFHFMNTFNNNSLLSLPQKFSGLKKVLPIEINSHKAIWIKMNHPANREGLYSKEDIINFNQYRELITDLWKNKQFQ